jgi:hypothetical protein
MGKSVIPLLVMVALAGAGPSGAQTSTPDTGIDVEIYNAETGGNQFEVEVGDTFWAHVLVRPGTTKTTCTIDCRFGTREVAGGPAAIATGVVDISFDASILQYVAAENNPATAAVDGLIQVQHAADGRIGWALAGDWTPDANAASGTLAHPCEMATLTASDWVVRLQFRLLAAQTTSLHIRRASDDPGFPLSFADVCGSEAFTQANGGIDEVIDAQVSPSGG